MKLPRQRLKTKKKDLADFQTFRSKLLRGYGGLKHTAKKIAEFIPPTKLYVEPFCGLASVSKFVTSNKIILNDMSDYIWKKYGLQKSMDNKIKYTKEDFEICIKRHDKSDTFFLIDPPWRMEHYTNNSKAFIDRTPNEYYKKISELIPDMKGDWIICGVSAKSSQSRSQCLLFNNINFHKTLVVSNTTLFGTPAKTLLLSNREFT